MKVNSYNKNNISFNGFWNSKVVKKGLEFASDNGALFAASTTLALSAGIRPLAILATPKTDEKNKKIACAKSIISGLLEFALTLAISAPIAKAFKTIDTNPNKYLKKESIEILKNGANSLKESKAYSLATQLFKLGLGFAVVLPKAILTSLGIPVILDNLLSSQKNTENIKENSSNNEINFQGKNNDKLAKELGKILDSKKLQKFANKYQDSNFPMHIFALKDVLATGAFVYQAGLNKKINDEQKPFLIKNSLISTALSIISSYTIDKITEKPAQKLVDKIISQNKNDLKLAKYIEGFKIIKPIFILAVVYYTIIPILSTYIAERLGKNDAKQS